MVEVLGSAVRQLFRRQQGLYEGTLEHDHQLARLAKSLAAQAKGWPQQEALQAVLGNSWTAADYVEAMEAYMKRCETKIGEDGEQKEAEASSGSR